jgi:hypothetical protein
MERWGHCCAIIAPQLFHSEATGAEPLDDAGRGPQAKPVLLARSAPRPFINFMEDGNFPQQLVATLPRDRPRAHLALSMKPRPAPTRPGATRSKRNMPPGIKASKMR